MPEPVYSVPHWRELPFKAVQLAGILAHEQAVVEAEAREALERDRPPGSKTPHRVIEQPRLPRRWRGGR